MKNQISYFLFAGLSFFFNLARYAIFLFENISINFSLTFAKKLSGYQRSAKKVLQLPKLQSVIIFSSKMKGILLFCLSIGTAIFILRWPEVTGNEACWEKCYRVWSNVSNLQIITSSVSKDKSFYFFGSNRPFTHQKLADIETFMTTSWIWFLRSRPSSTPITSPKLDLLLTPLSVRCQFHQCSTRSFYAFRSQQCKKILTT